MITEKTDADAQTQNGWAERIKAALESSTRRRDV